MATVTVRLLDEFHVDHDGERIAVGGPRPRALLARLALERGRSLRLDELLTDLWSEDVAGLRTTLRAYMSRLRRTPLGPWLEGGRSGYELLDRPGIRVDLWDLEDAVDTRPTKEWRGSDGVLATWRDDPLRGIGDPPFAASARARIRRAVDGMRLRDARDDLAAGRFGAALLTLRSLRVEHPDDDDLLALEHVARARADAVDRAFARLAPGPALARDERGHSAYPAPAPRERSPRTAATPPTSITRRRGIPTPISTFVGRREERAALTAALDVSRLVTLVGSAGVGKTRFAVEWLGSEATTGEEHIWFVGPRRGDTDPMGETVAAVVGAPTDTAEGIAEHLSDRRGILVIDGADAAARSTVEIVLAVLSRARGIAVLSTSRQALGIPGESVQHIAPLRLDDARLLFAARASRGPTPPDPSQVDALVEKLGRLPLAIELAAARAALMPLTDVAESMLRDLAPAEGGTGRAAGALSAAVHSALDLLDPAERDTLRQVSAFAGAFTREAAEAVCAGRPRDSDLDRLLTSSLLVAETAGGRSVLRVAEIVRRAALGDDTPDDDWERRHREWFAARADRASVALVAPESVDEISALKAEWPDVVAAFRSAEAHGDRASAASIVGGFLWFAVRSGGQRELQDLARRATAIPGAADATHEARLRLAGGFVAYQLGDMEESAAALAAAREQAERSASREIRSEARAYSAYLLTLDRRSAGGSATELAGALEAVDLLSDAEAAMVLLIAGQVQRASRRFEEAVSLLGRAEALARRSGHEWVTLMAPVVTAKVLLDQRRGAAAIEALLPVVDRSAATGDPVSLLIAVSVAAGAAATLGEDETGARIIGAADAIGRRYGFDPRANEPGDFELYLHRVRQGLTASQWRLAHAHGTTTDISGLVALVHSLGVR